MNNQIKKIVIVGGGSAGWLTAGILAAEFKQQPLPPEITLIESPDVATIGVGEGTWPTMRSTLQKIGISETQFIRECHASFKQGSKFVGWRDGALEDFYYHPFTLPAGAGVANVFAAWQNSKPSIPFSEAVCVQSRICEMGLAPKQQTMPEYAGALNYGYHLDAGKFAEMLREHCVSVLGVNHLTDHVEGVNSAENGDISSINCLKSGVCGADLFIDCSGSASILLGKHFKVNWVDQSRFSINDSAITAQIDYQNTSDPIASATISTAQSAGWIWDIALSNRRGVGYVYSSDHISDAAAESEFRNYLSSSVGLAAAAALSTRKLKFSAGHRSKFWVNNCVAVGMSAGFIEPLEASALALVELSANMIRDELPTTRDDIAIVAKRFNRVFEYRWQRIIDFLKLHYVLSERADSDYWKDATSAESIPDTLKEFLSLWQHRPPNRNDFLHAEEVFPPASYEYILYGMQFKPAAASTVRLSDNLRLGVEQIKGVDKNVAKFQSHLEPNRELIEKIYQYGMHKI